LSPLPRPSGEISGSSTAAARRSISEGRGVAGFVALEGFDPVAQAPHRRVLHKERHGDVDAEALLDAGREPGGGERVPAEVEKVVPRLDLALVQAERLFPDPLEQVLLLRRGASAGSVVLGRPPSVRAWRGGGGGSRLRSTLPEVAWIGSASSAT
jgi:hypothetical protein